MASSDRAPEKGAFGRLLRQYREHAGLGQERLAEQAGLSAPAISNLERGVSRPRLETVNLLAEALALPAERRAALLAAALRERAATGSPSLPAALAAPAPAVPPRHNLPVPPNALLGREREVAAVRARVQEPGMRLLTLTGVGGVGKTRVALAVGADLVDRYPDGVWLAELAPLADPALVPGVVAGALGLREEPNRPLATTLVEHLMERQVLLVLDNCEHLLDACAELASTLLRACPGVRILATSREGLGVSGEQIHQVPPLSVPNSQHLPPPELVGSYEAVRLFVARAQARRREFVLGEQTAAAVVTICERLDGIPLAIELAAARVGVLSVEQLAARLDDRFRLLTGGPRTVLPRHQTLRATLDWSYELLSEPERVLLRRLSVFAGGWTLEAAEGICAGEGLMEPDVLDLLGQLIHKSLILVEEQDDRARYQLLETVREYGQELLVAAGELSAVRDRHLDWYAALAEQAKSVLLGPEQTAWLARLEAEHDNLRAALAWSTLEHTERAATGLAMAAALSGFWRTHGHLSEGRRWLQGALSHSQAVPPMVQARALHAAGNLAVAQGDHEHARALMEEGLGLQRALGNRPDVSKALSSLGNVAYYQGEYERARALYEESLNIDREMGDTWGMASALGNLGNVAHDKGEYGRAVALHEESLALFRQVGDRGGTARTLGNLGNLARDQGDYARAVALHEAGLALKRELGDRLGLASSLGCLGGLACAEGNYKRATQLLQESLALAHELGDKRWIASDLQGLAEVAGARGQPERAIRLFGAADALRNAIGVPLSPVDRARQARHMTGISAALGEEVFAVAWAAGQALSFEKAAALALEDDASEQ